MASTRATAATEIDDATLDATFEPDPEKPGRHNVRFAEYGNHVWSVLGTLRRTGGNVAETAKEWGMPEDLVRAAIAYYERHRELFDAYFLLEREAYESEERLMEEEIAQGRRRVL